MLQQRVDCSCDLAFYHSLLFELHSEGPLACLCCGTVTCSRVIGETTGEAVGRLGWTPSCSISREQQPIGWRLFRA